MKDRFHIGDVAKEIYSNPNVFLVSVSKLNLVFNTYVLEHYQTALDWRNPYNFRQFSLWKPRPATDDDLAGRAARDATTATADPAQRLRQ